MKQNTILKIILMIMTLTLLTSSVLGQNTFFDNINNQIYGLVGINTNTPSSDRAFASANGLIIKDPVFPAITIVDTGQSNTYTLGANSINFIIYRNTTEILTATGSTGNIRMFNKLQIDDLSTAGSDPLCWDGSGTSFIGDCSSLSKYKENIIYLQPSYNWLTNKYLLIKPASYTWKPDYMKASHTEEKCDKNGENCYTEYIENEVYNKTEYGILADDLANVHEALVGYDENGEVKNVRWFNLITFNVLMIKSIIQKQQEQDIRLNEIEATLCSYGATKYC